MNMPWQIAVVASGLCAPALAFADHHHDAGAPTPQDDDHAFAASLSLVMADFDNTTYAGNYEGIVPGLQWAYGRLAVGATLPMYRLEENGRTTNGLGDAVGQARMMIGETEHLRGGISVAVSAPTGDAETGFGMGHVMVMPAAFGAWSLGRVVLAGSAGPSFALDSMGHDHGPWPLVEPMNERELTWSASGDTELGADFRAGARLTGGIPFGSGNERVSAGVRVGWNRGRVTTAAELQAGIAGDPFTLRGVVETALRF
jgi:hypothetical protein